MNFFRLPGTAQCRRFVGPVVGLVLATGGCAKVFPPLVAREAGPAAASPADGVITEAALIAAVRGQWENSGSLPKHVVIHAAPFEVVAPGPNGVVLRLHVWVRCTEDSFVPVRQVVGRSGRISTVVRKVFVKGQLIEIPLRVEVTVGAAGGISFAASAGRTREEWGEPLAGFVHPVDLATSAGAKLATAPDEWARAEEWLREHRTMEEDYGRLRQALATRPNLVLWSRDELGSLIRRYPAASEALWRDGQRLQREGRPPKDFQLPPNLALLIRDDDARFQADYLERERQRAAATRILDGT